MTDFEAEGLLDGTEGEARAARRRLLEQLSEEGVPLEELREAVAGGRLTLLPVERALAGGSPRYTPREVAELSGVDLDLLQRATAALGVPYPDPDMRSLTEADLEEAHRVKAFIEAGLPEDGILQVARTIGMGTSRIAEANRELVVRTLMQPGDTERDLALRFAAAAEHMLPLIGPTLVYALQTHMLEQVRRDVIGAADLASGEVGGTVEVAVCFADLVGFTKLGEQIETEELGLVAGRLDELATAVAEPPVRLVKLIGDAAMLVSTEAEAMVEAALRLVEAADEEGDEFPRLRAGVAYGSALVQAGDYYGRPVNLASRITAIAKPGSVLIDEATMEATETAFRYSYAGERRLKGFDSRVKLYRSRRPAGEEYSPAGRRGEFRCCGLLPAMTGKKQQRTSKALWNLAQRQHGVVTRAQLLAHGLTAAAIEHRLAKGRLYRLWRGVYAVGRPEVSEKGRWMAAVLSCGSQALLSHRNAGALWGVTSGISGIEVTVPGGRDRRRPVFVSIDEQTSGLSIAASSTGSQ